jgi:putative ABC transport system ATP-binding protein
MGLNMILEGRNIVKIYNPETVPVHALRGVDIKIKKGEMVAVIGPSGSGKSTLLHMLGLLDRPTKGKVFIDGEDTTDLTSARKSGLRLRKIGYIFQEYNLIPELTAMENVSLPGMMNEKKDYEDKALEVLEAVGLEKRAHHRPFEMSGGEQQRVAIARALVNDPVILLADEPTANLDSATGDSILSLFKSLNEKKGQTVLIITHEVEHVKTVDRVINLKDGLITTQSVKQTLARCIMCNSQVIKDSAVEKKVKGKTMYFCCSKCAEDFK